MDLPIDDTEKKESAPATEDERQESDDRPAATINEVDLMAKFIVESLVMDLPIPEAETCESPSQLYDHYKTICGTRFDFLK